MSLAALQPPPSSPSAAPASSAAVSPTDETAMHEALQRLHHHTAPWDIAADAVRVLTFMLRREHDKPLLQDIFGKLAVVVTRSGLGPQIRAHACVKLIKEARERRISRPPVSTPTLVASLPADLVPAAMAREDETTGDIQYIVTPLMEKMSDRLKYTTPQPPAAASGFDTFRALAEDAILHRVDTVLAFFQRHHPGITRELPPPFLLSPLFASRLRRGIIQAILPALPLEGRHARANGTACDWSTVDTHQFWEVTSEPFQTNLLRTWRAAWADLRLIETWKDGQRIWQIKPHTKKLRGMLSAEEWEYSLPKLSNRELDLFSTLFDPAINWPVQLRGWWQKCHQTYVQEMEPQLHQQRARQGCFRDTLLEFLTSTPKEWRDFIILLTHRTFPRIDTAWLLDFSRNFGRGDDAARQAELPHLMPYLAAASEHPSMFHRERSDERDWKAMSDELRRHAKGTA